ncbi:hypothetical protein MEG_01273 [Bartonella tamiae Th307]|uniref:Uncharacterized protein n=1 Tax=Bartonella tamiae Th239 TaxID=1094558 RepID=J0QYT6_9HYPH|nr:hypothetical protein ME5_00608 [Bartonella tamiae Th239]EJF93059.1 hypothetical protein MEG_01273 [Bartonella tamiae Th307]
MVCLRSSYEKDNDIASKIVFSGKRWEAGTVTRACAR